MVNWSWELNLHGWLTNHLTTTPTLLTCYCWKVKWPRDRSIQLHFSMAKIWALIPTNIYVAAIALLLIKRGGGGAFYNRKKTRVHPNNRKIKTKKERKWNADKGMHSQSPEPKGQCTHTLTKTRPHNDGRTEVWSQTNRNAAHAAILRHMHLRLPDRKSTLLQTQTHRCGWRRREIHCWWRRFIAWRAWLWPILWTDWHPPHATFGWPSWSACRTGCPVDTERGGCSLNELWTESSCHATHFLNQCDISKVEKVVHGNWS